MDSIPTSAGSVTPDGPLAQLSTAALNSNQAAQQDPTLLGLAQQPVSRPASPSSTSGQSVSSGGPDDDEELEEEEDEQPITESVFSYTHPSWLLGS